MQAKLDFIREFVVQGLVNPPARAGMRLKSEPELAVMLKTKRGRVRLAIDELVEAGILSRRLGSGTFLRKVPPMSAASADVKIPPTLAGLKPSMVFADPANPDLRRKPKREHRALNLGLVTDHKFSEESPSDTYRSMLHGMEERARRDGHHFLQIQISSDEFSEERAADLDRQLDGLSLDGCLVRAVRGAWIDQILEPRKIPRAHFSDYRLDEIPHPCIMLDLADALRSAVLRLHREGCRRIGHYGLKGRFLAPGLRETFEATMDKLGLPSGRAEYLDLDPEAVASGVERMMSFDKPPDGVFVSDDVLLKYLAAEWKKLGLTPGEDFSVITLSCRGNDLPGGVNWSRTEFDPYQVGRMAMDTLLQSIQTVEGDLCSFIHVAAYIPGVTTRGE